MVGCTEDDIEVMCPEVVTNEGDHHQPDRGTCGVTFMPDYRCISRSEREENRNEHDRQTSD